MRNSGQSLAAPGYRVADVEHALAGRHQLRDMSIPEGQRLRQPQGLPATVRARPRGHGCGSGRRREELKGNSVRVAEGDPGAVMGVLDPAMNDAELVQARDPCPQLITATAGERNMIKAGAVLVEPVTSGPGMGVQAEQLHAANREHGVVKVPGLLVLIQDRPAPQQLAVPAGASLKISHGHSDMGDRRELRHCSLLIDGGRETGYPDLARALPSGA